MADPLRFFLAGSTGLLAECGRRLLDAGQSVVAVWAPDPATIPGFLVGAAGPGTLPEALARAEFDYLLSVANPCLLGPEALARARCGAINYHDAPLPRFAGRHAAPRAILRGESTHGVTWHQMVPRVDAGAILVQEVFPVDPEETSFSLHLKCFEAALRTFDRLLEGLRAGTLVSVPQDLTRRTWFSSTDRLPDQGRLRWDLPARELSARVRSADFGPEPNDWGTCWFEGPEGPVQVGMLQVDLLPRVAPAGAILEVGPREVTVASADLPVRLGRLQGADLGSPAWAAARVLGREAGPQYSVPELFARAAARWPERPAVLTGTDSWSYARLEEESNRLAAALLHLGLTSEEPVAVMLERSPELLAAALGVMKAGGAWLPLDLATPAPRLERILTEARPRAVVARNPVPGWPWLSPEAAREWPGEPCGVPIPLGTLAYVIYTSGSTGEPKGVMVEHRALSWFLDVDVQSHHLGSEDRVLQLCSPGFDSAVEEIFSALVCGAAVALRPEGADLEVLLDYCRDRDVTVMGLFPGMLGPALDVMEARGFPPTVRLVTTGGEPVRAPDVERWQAFFRARDLAPPRLVNNFGLTEVTVVSLACDLTERELGDGRVPIGHPLPGTRLRILDEAGQEALEGELYLGGPGLARGYLGRPDLAAERFVDLGGERLYRTGDRVRRGAQGELEFTGRSDRQVKVRGYRVELEEVEAALARHEAVRECAVLQLPGGSLRAWVVVRGPVDAASLRQGLLGDLPEWMVPSGIEVVEDLPRTVAGKVDRRALVDRAGRVPAVAALEDRELRTMLGLWREVLGRSEIGPDWDFFDQGGDSLTALRLCSRLQGWQGRPVPLPALARARTPRALLEALGRPQTCRYLQPLSAVRDGPVRVFVHPLGGSAEVYRGLAALLPGPAIGFQAMQEPEHPSVEEMARRYLEELLAYQADGPYCLAGLSLGGLVAFEMACRLEAAGKAVERLALIDTVVPGHGTPILWVGGSRRLQSLLRGGQRLAHHLGTLMRQRPGDRLPYLRRLVRRSGAAGKGIGTTRRESGITPAVPTSARGDYQPGFFPGELLLVRVRHQTPLLRVDRALGWTDHARAVRAVEVPGLHGTSLLEPPLVEDVAAALAGRVMSQEVV